MRCSAEQNETLLCCSLLSCAAQLQLEHAHTCTHMHRTVLPILVMHYHIVTNPKGMHCKVLQMYFTETLEVRTCTAAM